MTSAHGAARRQAPMYAVLQVALDLAREILGWPDQPLTLWSKEELRDAQIEVVTEADAARDAMSRLLSAVYSPV